MKYFDAHLHLPSADQKGLDAFLRHLDDEQGFVGGNLILNHPSEVDFIDRFVGRIPQTVNIIPYYDTNVLFPETVTRTGWYKIHPRISRIDTAKADDLIRSVLNAPIKPRGIIVDCYPWGPEIQYNVGLRLVIGFALAHPTGLVLATHGGGYESWAYRAHAGPLENVLFDFSQTMSHYKGSDILRPFQRYIRWSRHRVVFGSDWPSAPPAEQLQEHVRLAAEVGIDQQELETLLLENAVRIWHPGQ